MENIQKNIIPENFDIELLRNLSETRGCSGHEKAIRDFIKSQITPICDEVKTDTIGNLFGIKYGKNKSRSILFTAHMDEIGFIVRYIDQDGFIRVSPIGGQNNRLLPGSRVLISGKDGDVPGIFGEKAIHYMEQEERKKVSDIKDLFIDSGFSNKKEAEKHISIGNYAEFDQKITIFPNGKRVNGKSIDDRAGCYALIRTLREIAKSGQPDYTLIFAFTTQEELGVRGATTAAYQFNPTLAIVLEVTHAFDFPTVTKSKFADVSMGKGASITVGPNLHPEISGELMETAKRNEIPFQINPSHRPTGTDARIIQITREGIPVGLITVPLRYMHTAIESMEFGDLENVVSILTKFIQEKKDITYNF